MKSWLVLWLIMLFFHDIKRCLEFRNSNLFGYFLIAKANQVLFNLYCSRCGRQKLEIMLLNLLESSIFRVIVSQDQTMLIYTYCSMLSWYAFINNLNITISTSTYLEAFLLAPHDMDILSIDVFTHHYLLLIPVINQIIQHRVTKVILLIE